MDMRLGPDLASSLPAPARSAAPAPVGSHLTHASPSASASAVGEGARTEGFASTDRPLAASDVLSHGPTLQSTAPSGGNSPTDTVTLGSRRATHLDDPTTSAQQAQAALGLPGTSPYDTFQHLAGMPADERRQAIQAISCDPTRSTAFTQMEGLALRDPQASSALSGFLQGAAADPSQAAALTRVQAQAATTEQGRQAIIGLQDGLSHDVGAATAMRQVSDAAMQLPEGRAARNDLFMHAASDPMLAGAVYREMVPSASNGAGSTDLAAFMRDAGSDPQSAEAFSRLQTAAARDPQGREAVADTWHAASTDPDVGRAALRIDNTAMQTASGREAVTQRLQGMAHDPELAGLQMGALAGAAQTDEGRQWFGAMRHDPQMAAGFSAMEAAAVQTPAGRAAEQQLLGHAATDPSLAADIEGTRAAAAQTPQGREALTHFYDTASQHSDLAASLARADNAALRTDDGRQQYAALHHEASQSAPLAGAMVHAETTALQTPEGREAQRQVIDTSSRIGSLATARTEMQAAAASTKEGASNLAGFYRAVASDPHLAAAQARQDATAASVPGGQQQLAARDAALSHEPQAAAARIDADRAAASTPDGRAALETTWRAAAKNPDLATARVQLEQGAASDPQGAASLGQLYHEVGADAALSTAHAAVETGALQAPEGREATAALMGVEARDPLLNAAHEEAWGPVQRLAVQDDPEANRLLSTHLQEVSQPDLARTSLTRDAALVRTPDGEAQLEYRLSVIATQPELATLEVGRRANGAGGVVSSAEPGGAVAGSTAGGEQPELPPISPEGSTALQRADGRVVAAAMYSENGRAALENLRVRTGVEPATSMGGGISRTPDDAASVSSTAVESLAAAGWGPAASKLLSSPYRLAAPPVLDVMADGVGAPSRGSRLAIVDTDHEHGLAEAPFVTSESRMRAFMVRTEGGVSEPMQVDAPRRGRLLDESQQDDIGAVDTAKARTMAPLHSTQESQRLAPVEAVQMFDTSPDTQRACTRCGTHLENRAPGCPSCQSEHREMLISSMSSIQRSGYIVDRQTDAVEVTASARQELEAPEAVASMRKAATFVQLRDVLALCSPSVTGYATVSTPSSSNR